MVIEVLDYYQKGIREMRKVARVNIERIYEFMKKNNFTEYSMSKAMGISYSYLFRVLRGKREAGGKFIDGLIKVGMLPKEIFLQQPLPKGNTGTDG